MRRLLPALLITLALTPPWPAAARTSGRVCRRECAPRVAEQCDGLGGGDFRTCRKSLVRACKDADPRIACPTTIQLTRALAGRVARAGRPADLEVALCESGRFSALDDSAAAGTWDVRIVDGSLTLDLEGGTSPLRRLRLERDAAGGLLVDTAPVELADGAAACTPPAPPAPPAPAPPLADPEHDATLVALARTLSDRSFTRVVDGGSSVEKQVISACSSGRATLVSVVTAGGTESITTLGATWTIRVTGSVSLLVLDTSDGTSHAVPVALGDDGRLLVDGAQIEPADARGTCADADLRDRLTQALNDTAFLLTESFGAIPVRVKIGLCASGRHVFQTTTSRRGPWQVEVASGAAELQLLDDSGAVVRHFPVAFGDDGVVRLNGQIGPVDDPTLVTLACEG